MPQRLVLLLAILVCAFRAHASEECEKWFLKSRVKAGTDRCLIDCSAIATDMSTFFCATHCDRFCKTYITPDNAKKIALYIDPRGLNKAEQSLSAKYPKDAMKVYFAKKSALNATRRIFSDSSRNDESDAFRHFVWAGLSSHELGPEKARAFLEAHEEGGLPTESEMDTKNNESGMKAAKELQDGFSQKALEQQALEKLKAGELTVISPSGKVPTWSE